MSEGLPDINGPKNVSGEVKFVKDSTTQPTGENVIIEYTYKVQYIDTIVGRNVPFDKKPEWVQQKQINNLLKLGIDIVNKRKEITTNVKTVQREEGITNDDLTYIPSPEFNDLDSYRSTNNREDESKKIYAFLSDKEIDEYLNPKSEDSNQSGVGMVVIVGNNAGLPTYTFSNTLFTVGNEEQAINLAKQSFEIDPPYMTIPAADIYSVDENTGDILVDQDWYEQQYPPEGSEVEFVGELEPIPYTFNSIVVDGITNKLIPFARVEDLDGNFTYTDAKGKFTLQGEYIPGEIQQISVSSNSVKPNYNVFTTSITTQAGNLRNDINFITLFSSTVNTDSSILKTKSTPDSVKNRLDRGDVKNFIGATVKKAMDEIQNRLYPFIINKLLTEPFGIGDPIELIKQAKKQSEDLRKNKRKKSKKTDLIFSETLSYRSNDPSTFVDEQGQTSMATYKDQSDQAIFLRSLAPGESFIDGNGNMFTADSRGRIRSGSSSPDSTYDNFERVEFREQTNDFTYEFESSNEFELITPIIEPIDEEIDEIDIILKRKKKKTPKEKPTKSKNKGKKYKIKSPKTKSTILKRNGKFRKGGNKRSKNKKIKFSGKRRY